MPTLEAVPEPIAAGVRAAGAKPRVVFFRSTDQNYPAFVRIHRREQVKCLQVAFDVRVITHACDFAEICDRHEPDLAIFESGTYCAIRDVSNTAANASIPRLGFLHADAYCCTRSVFLSDMARWGVESYFTNSVSMADYTPEIADRIFVWPNFVDTTVYRDYGHPKLIPVLLTGANSSTYPWRNRIRELLTTRYSSLITPHLGWQGARETSQMIQGQDYAELLNRACFAPACGSISKDVVRKHFEIPACNACLIAEPSASLEAAGFVSMVNCVLADESDLFDKLDGLFEDRDHLDVITRRGYDLVHSRHTLEQRTQVFQWFTLNAFRRPGERIVQRSPFGPLELSRDRRTENSSYALASGIDRKVLAAAEVARRQGRYDEAVSGYLECLRYWSTMPEAILGMTLCELSKGNSASAINWISQSIELSLINYRALQPDPVQWAFYIVALLCSGDVAEARRRSAQFPALYHIQLGHVRAMLDALGGPSRPPVERENARPRLSVHKLPEAAWLEWVEMVVGMLEACGQARLADRLRGSLGPVDGRLALHGARDASNVGAGASAGSWRNVIPLIPAPWHARFRHRTVSEMRVFLHSLDRHAPAVASWLRRLRGVAVSWRHSPREDRTLRCIREYASRAPAQLAAIVGHPCRSDQVAAFLSGIRNNRRRPSLAYLTDPTLGSAADIARAMQEVREPSPPEASNGWANDVRFDIMLVGRRAEDSASTLIRTISAQTVIVTLGSDGPPSRVVRELSSDRRYRMVWHHPASPGGCAIFEMIKTPRSRRR